MRGIRALLVLLVVGSVITGIAVSASSRTKAIEPIPAFSNAELTAEPGANWITARGDLYNRQYSSLSQITKANVKNLKVAWHTRVIVPTKGKPNFTGVSAEAEPVVYNGTMYMPDAKGNVYAFDAVTGERLWYYKPKYPKNFSAGLPTSRGVVLGDGKVYMAQTDGSIVGLDQSTGRVAWKTNAGNYKLGYFFTSPPTYVNGMLVIGQSGGDFGARCKVLGLDAKTGKIKWKFDLIPTKGVGANTWPTKRAYLGGGAVWAPLAADPAMNMVYIGVGNPVPYNGNVRGKGKELFTESVVALRISNGKYVWHYQTVHHDIWDYDTAANPLVVFDLNIKGKNRKAVASMGKTGWIYMLDRRNGKPILGIPEKKVPQSSVQHTWPTQPIPNGEPFARQCPDKKAWSKWKTPDGKPLKIGCLYTPYNDKQYTVFSPAALGGVDWPPSSFSNKTGYMYVCSKDSDAAWKALPEAQAGKLKPLGNFFQIEGLFVPPGSPALKTTQGKVVAMNMRTNKRAWTASFPMGDICYSGVMSTAGGLVFVGRNNNTLQAYDDFTGKLLWTSPKLVASVAAPPMTYTVDGKQYVSVYAGGNGLASGFGTAKVKYGSDLYTFALPQ